jgi:hypothetical protein
VNQLVVAPRQEMTRVKNLRGAPYNPRVMPDEEMRNLMASLRQYGFLQPLVARRSDGELAGGHQRLAAFLHLARDLGVSAADMQELEVPVIWVDFDDAKMRTLNLALNRIRGDWDYERLAVVLGEIATLSPTEMTVTGFSDSEVEDIRALAPGEDQLLPVTAPDDVEAQVARMHRRFVFEFDEETDAQEVDATLRAFGMTGPSNAASALLAIVRAASGKVPEPVVPQPKARRRAQSTKQQENSDGDDGDAKN